MGNQQGASIDTEELAGQVRDIWNKDLKELPIAQDIPRLARKITVYDHVHEPVNFVDDPKLQKQDSQSKIEDEKPPSKVNDPVLSRIIFSIFCSLANEIPDLNCQGYSISGMTLELFDREVNIADNQSINGFLLRYFGEKGSVVRLLKAVNQSIVAPPVTQLKMLLTSKIDYKDVKGGWTIKIECGKDEIVVTHFKAEQVMNNKKEHFKFEWCFILTFSTPKEDDPKRQFLELKKLGMKFIRMHGEAQMSANDQAEMEEATKFLAAAFSQINVEYDDKLNEKLSKRKKKK